MAILEHLGLSLELRFRQFAPDDWVKERIAERIKAEREYDAEQERMEREWLQSRPPRPDQ